MFSKEQVVHLKKIKHEITEAIDGAIQQVELTAKYLDYCADFIRKWGDKRELTFQEASFKKVEWVLLNQLLEEVKKLE
ncbi:hypothetical protein ACFL29_01180 [Patescibacteria group bacterium]